MSKLLTFTPSDVAEQLTLIDLEILRKIQPQEFIGNVPWTKPTKLEKSPNIVAAISHSNNLSYWAISEVLLEKDVTKRAEIVTWLIKLAQTLYESKSFNSCAAIAHAIGNGSVDRLNLTWGLVDKNAREEYQRIAALIDPRDAFASYKGTMNMISGKVVPYLAVALFDIHNIETQRNATSDEAVDQAVDNYLSLLDQATFNFVERKDIRDYLESFKRLSETETYDISKSLEPRVVEQPPSPTQTQKSLASSDIFFWGVPVLALAIAAGTALVLYKRKQ